MFHLWRKKQRLLPLLALLLGTQACFNQKDFDPELIAGLKASPFVAVPLLHGSLSIEDLLAKSESQFITIDEDNLIHINHSDTLYSTAIRDHFLLPDRALSRFYTTGTKALNPGSKHTLVEERKHIDLEFNEVRFDEIQLKGGVLSLSATSNIEEDVELQLTFPTLKQQGQDQPLVLHLTLPKSETNIPQSTEGNLKDHTLDLRQFSSGNNLVPVEIMATTTPEQQDLLLDVASYIDLKLSMEGLEFSLLTGYFGQPEVSLPQGELALGFFDQLFSKSKFGLKDPSLRFDFLNSNGVPVQVQKDVLQVRKSTGETLALTTEPSDQIDLSYPATPGETATTSLLIANVGEVIDFVPDYLDYKLTGRLNVGQPQDIVNFLTDSSRSVVVFHADIPLWGWLEGITLSDTMAMGLEPDKGQVQEDADGGYTITDAEGEVRTLITNQFPLGSEVQVYFTNAQYAITDSLFTNGPFRIEASQIDANGDLLAAEVSKEDLPISDKQLEHLLEADYLIIKALLYTSRNADGSQPDVKIKSDYTFDVKLGLKARMNISVKK